MEYRLRINSCGTVRCEPGWRWDVPSHRFTDFDLWYVWDGVGTVHLNQVEYPAHRGSLFVFHPGSQISARHDPHRRLGVCFIHFDFINSRNTTLHPQAKHSPQPVNLIRHADLHETMIRRIVDLHQSLQKSAAARLLESVILSLPHDGHVGIQSEDDKRRDEKIADVVRSIRENPGETTPVAQLAERAGYSVDHFTRIFTEKTGLRPKEFAIRVRIERARMLLRDSRLDIGQVAAMLGYADLYYFSRHFKHCTGVTPTAWRKSTR